MVAELRREESRSQRTGRTGCENPRVGDWSLAKYKQPQTIRIVSVYYKYTPFMGIS